MESQPVAVALIGVESVGPVASSLGRHAVAELGNAGAGVKTNLLFFTRGKPTERIWYFDLSDVKVGKKSPLTLTHFEEFFRLFPERGDSEWSWTVSWAEIEGRGFDLKAVNPNRKVIVDERTPE